MEGRAILALDATAAWDRELDDSPSVQAAFQGLSGSGFVLQGAKPAADTALLGLGLHVRNDDDISFGFHADSRIGTGTTILTGTADLEIKW